MPLATLSIDLEARLGKLQESLGSANTAIQRSLRQIDSGFAGVNRTIAGLAATLAGGFSAGVITRLVSGAIEGVDALNDLADAVGTSVENASALEDAAKRTGTSLDVVSTAALKLNQVLGDAKPGSAQAATLEAIGLSAQRLRDIDPAQALLEVAKALAGYADDGNKARLVQELFGKSTKEVAGFLKDLAEQQKLVGTVTSQQAAEADRLKREIAGLQKSWEDLTRVATFDLAPSLIRLLDVMKRFGPSEVRLLDVISGRATSRFVAALNGDAGPVGGGRGTIVPPTAAERLRQLEDRGFLPSIAPPPGAGATGGGRAGGRGRTGTTRDLFELVGPLPDDSLAEALRAIERTDAAKLAELTATLQRLLAIQGGGDGRPEVAQAITDITLAIDELNAKSLPGSTDPRDALRRIEYAGYDETSRLLAQMEDRAKRVENIGERLGLTFASAFEDAIVGGGRLSDLVRNLEQDIIRMVTRLTVTEPLLDYLKGAIKGAGGGDFFGSLFSTLGNFLPSFDVGTPYVPRDMVAMIHKGERIVPAAQNRVGMAGGGMTNHFHFHITGAPDLRTQQQIAAAAARGVERAALRNN